ncbi:hypothetical protein EWH70_11855 [Amycolatopsis suaedae]|uniref:Uncharacterized protein n=1 Tax=Amycolatopsis suaedae TaxID=2510978 RepID=A0A4Q7JA59_9PSEU|nr:hypothetical protein EWH70_11855 [Amycolatopsis suaedae]
MNRSGASRPCGRAVRARPSRRSARTRRRRTARGRPGPPRRRPAHRTPGPASRPASSCSCRAGTARSPPVPRESRRSCG